VVIGQPQYSLTYQYQPVTVQHAAIVSTGDRAASVADVIDTEVENAVDRAPHPDQPPALRQRRLADLPVRTTTASTTVSLNATTGQDALLRQWLHPGLVVDIGTTASEASIVADTVISVAKSTTSPTITIGSSVSDDLVALRVDRQRPFGHDVFRDERPEEHRQHERHARRRGGRRPVAGGSVDSSTTTLTLDAMLAVQEGIMQETGKFDVDVLTSYHQMRNFYNLFQNQVRFQSDSAIEAGNTDAIKWNGMTVRGQYHCPSTKMFFVNFDDLLLVTGSNGLHWLDEAFGSGNRLSNNANTTAFTGTVSYPLNLAAQKRISHGALTALA
jgi:hypothetical protein